MNLLLDTHSFIWFIEGNPRLSETARTLITDGGNEVFLSVASLWEMAIKISLGKLGLSEPYEVFIATQLQLNQIGLLDISFSHTVRVTKLPFHHRDPFDRLLNAQSLVEDIPIVSIDAKLDDYGVRRIWKEDTESEATTDGAGQENPLQT